MLDGRLIVQLTSGTPSEARSLESWAASRGADYLDGAIGAWPRQIGGPDADSSSPAAKLCFHQPNRF